MLTVGIDIRGARIAGGLADADGVILEKPHTLLLRDGLPCGHGQSGCLEQHASGRARHHAAGNG